MRNHLNRQQLESLTLCWEQWEAEATTRTQKILRARLHLIFLLMRYGGLRLGEVLALVPRACIDTITGMLRVSGSNAREILLPVSAMRNIRRILGLPQAAEPDFLQFDQSFCAKNFTPWAASWACPPPLWGRAPYAILAGLSCWSCTCPCPWCSSFWGSRMRISCWPF